MIPDPNFRIGGLNAKEFENRVRWYYSNRLGPSLEPTGRASPLSAPVAIFRFMAEGRASPVRRLLSEIRTTNWLEARSLQERLMGQRARDAFPETSSSLFNSLVDLRLRMALCEWFTGVFYLRFRQQAPEDANIGGHYQWAHALLNSYWTIYGEITPFHGPFCADAERYFAGIGDSSRALEMSIASEKWPCAVALCLQFCADMSASETGTKGVIQ